MKCEWEGVEWEWEWLRWEAAVVVVVDDGDGGSDELARCGDAAMCFFITPAGMACRAVLRLTHKDYIV